MSRLEDEEMKAVMEAFREIEKVPLNPSRMTWLCEHGEPEKACRNDSCRVRLVLES